MLAKRAAETQSPLDESLAAQMEPLALLRRIHSLEELLRQVLAYVSSTDWTAFQERFQKLNDRVDATEKTATRAYLRQFRIVDVDPDGMEWP